MSTIVSLHAHPDDETLLTGGWLAQRANAGDRVVIVYATDGAGGLSGSTGDLGSRRRSEAQAAADALGAARVIWLGYSDSGMSGEPTTSADRFAAADVDEAARKLAGILDEESADLLTGYDANGGYGHPDHRQVHRVARAARDLATSRPRLLEATRDRRPLVALIGLVRPLAGLLRGITLPTGEIYADRAAISHRVDVRDVLAVKRAALAAHRSQRTGGLRTISLLLALPSPFARGVLGTEWFVEVP